MFKGRKHEGEKKDCDCGRHSEHEPISLYYVALHWGLDIWETGWEVGNSFLQGSESILHVLQQLGIVSFDLSFTILDRILNDTWNAQSHLTGLMSNMGKQNRKPNISCHMRNKCVPWTSWSWSCTGSPPCFPWWWPRWFCCHSELWTPPHVGPCRKTLSCLRGCQQFCRRGKTWKNIYIHVV